MKERKKPELFDKIPIFVLWEGNFLGGGDFGFFDLGFERSRFVETSPCYRPKMRK